MNAANQIDEKGHPIVLNPPGLSLQTRVMRTVMMYVIVPVVAPCILLFKTLKDETFRKDLWNIYRVVNEAERIQDQPYYQSPELLSLLWKQPSAKHYIQHNALEYQNSEGYCGRATLRCILQSFGLPQHLVPPVKRGESKPEKWCQDMQKLLEGAKHRPGSDHDNCVQLSTEIVRGDVSYAEFLRTLERIETSPNERLALNYLRSALFGFKQPKYLFTHLLFGLFGGHFSPIVGIVRENRPKDDPLVGVFDVNHTYGGAYLVPATVLHESVKVKDGTNSKSRALIVVSMEKEYQ